MENIGRILPANAAVVEAASVPLSLRERICCSRKDLPKLRAERRSCCSIAGEKQNALIDFLKLLQ